MNIHMIWCSTPFGVIGLFTSGYRPGAGMEDVLNAVWRHWIVHHTRDGRNYVPKDVLNAVWRHWIVHVGRADGNDWRADVLNAVWRHWIVHFLLDELGE